MTDAPLRIWLQEPVGLDYERSWCAEPMSDDDDEYHLHTREALAQSPIVQAMIAEAVERETRSVVAERDRAQKACEQILKRFTPRRLRYAPKDRIIIGVERPPCEDETFFYDLIWDEDRQDFVTPFVGALNGATHFIDPRDLIGIVWPSERAAIRRRG